MDTGGASTEVSHPVAPHIIRRIGPDDLAAFWTLADLLRVFNRETAFREAPEPSKEFGMRTLFQMTLVPEQYAIIVAEAEGKIVGFCMGDLIPAHYFIPDYLCVREFAWWVAPDWRQTSLGARLLHALRAWGEERGAKMLSYGRPLTSKQERPGVYHETITRVRLGD